MKKVAEWKKKEVNVIKELVNKYPIFGVVDMENLPSLQLQKMKMQLKNVLLVRMSKKRLIKIALSELKDKKNMDDVVNNIKGMPALIFTKENPFKLYGLLAESKSSAPAKTGQIAQNDIYVNAGPTPHAPGPIIGELGQLGIKTEVKEGKVAVKEDKLIVKEGEVIDAKVADILGKLGIEPMEVGLNLILAYEDGLVYKKDVLAVDEEAYINNIKLFNQECVNLAVYIGYITKDTVEILIRKAFNEANYLADSQSILTSENVKKLLGEAEREVKVLKDKLDLPVEEKVEVKEEKPEVKEEVKFVEPKEEKKPLKYFKEEEKKPTSEEILKEIEDKEKKEEEKTKEIKDVEKIVQDLKDKKIKEEKK